jgi:hypothetical protein
MIKIVGKIEIENPENKTLHDKDLFESEIFKVNGSLVVYDDKQRERKVSSPSFQLVGSFCLFQKILNDKEARIIKVIHSPKKYNDIKRNKFLISKLKNKYAK